MSRFIAQRQSKTQISSLFNGNNFHYSFAAIVTDSERYVVTSDVALHTCMQRVRYRSLSLTIAAQCSAVQRSREKLFQTYDNYSLWHKVHIESTYILRCLSIIEQQNVFHLPISYTNSIIIEDYCLLARIAIGIYKFHSRPLNSQAYKLPSRASKTRQGIAFFSAMSTLVSN